MEIYVFGHQESSHLSYTEVPWDLDTKTRTDIDHFTGLPMQSFVYDDKGSILRDDFLNPLMKASDGCLIPVQTDVWVENRAFTVPFGPCCINNEVKQERYADREDVFVCRGVCCRQPVQVKISTISLILKHIQGIARHMPPANAKMMDLGGPFRGESIRGMPDGACLFWNPASGECALQTYAQESGIDPDRLRPIPCSLFPLQVQAGWMDHGPRYFAMFIDPIVMKQHNVNCPTAGNGSCKPAYLSLKREFDSAFGGGFWEVMVDVYERHFKPACER